ncbi:hypothetical protein [Alteromonas sp. 14N.309.X.WAT.G.H12]|uniref:hypothetical protein n=1 Tax=Alteromonas sp. 14N.309.X.WAT.G.H12 TaxID=3120824 RepID=UPI002FCF5E68
MPSKKTTKKNDAPTKAPIDHLAKGRGKYAASAAQSFRRILHIEELNKFRNDNFDSAYAARAEQYKKLFADLSESRLKGLMEAFTREYYKPEYNLLAEYQAKRTRWETLQEKGNGSPLPHAERKEFETLSATMQMNEFEYVGSRLLDHDIYKQIKETFDPKQLKQLLDKVDVPIRAISKKMDESLLPDGVRKTHAATIEFFSTSKPELKAEIESMKTKAIGEAAMEPFKQASAILRAGMILHNPSGYLVSKGLSVIMNTKTMRPFANSIKTSVDNMVEKSGIKASIKREVQKLSPRAAKMIAGGLAVAAFGVLTMTGVIDPVEAVEKGMAFVDDVTTNDFLPFSLEDGYADSSLKLGSGDIDIFTGENAPSKSEVDLLSNMGIVVDGEAQPSPDVTLSASADVNTEVASTHDEPTIKDALANNGTQPTGGDAPASEELPDISNEFYKIQPGDTLSEIIAARLEAAQIPYDYMMIDSYVDKVVEMNSAITDPNLILAGSTIELPEVPSPKPVISVEALVDAQNDITCMPDPISSKEMVELNQLCLYPTNDPAGDALQEAVEILSSPEYQDPGLGTPDYVLSDAKKPQRGLV